MKFHQHIIVLIINISKPNILISVLDIRLIGITVL